MKHRYDFTLFGQDFEVFVEEKDGERSVKIHNAEARKQKGHSYVIHRDEREASKGGLFSDEKELPPLGEHVAEATNEAIQKWLRLESRERGFEQSVEDAIESTAELWRTEFTKAEDFKEL